MTVKPAFHPGADDTTEALQTAVDIIDRSAVALMMQPGVPPQNQPGRPSILPQYQLRAVLITMLELAWACKKLSWPNVVRALWFRYTREQLAIVGLPNWRCPDRRAAMRPHITRRGTRQERLAARRVFKAEVQRLQDFVDSALATIDDTPLPANRRHGKAAYKAAVLATPELVARNDLQKKVINAIVFASLTHGNAVRHPDLDPTDLTAGILRHYCHDVAIDEHEVTVSLANTNKNTRPVVGMATDFAHVRREKYADAIGLTIAVAVARPQNRRIPNLALGIALHDPSGGSRQGVLDCLAGQAITQTRPKPNGAARHYVITDMGYVGRDGLNAQLIDRGYSLVTKYPSNWQTTHELAAGPPETTALPLFNGKPLCPGVTPRILNNLTPFEAPNPRTMTGEQLVAHEPAETFLSAMAMGRAGRPVRAKRAKSGRPRIGSKPLEGVYTVELVCPALEMRARCGIVTESIKLPPTVPAVPNPPIENPPRCCTDGTITLRLQPEHVKIFQDKMVGTWDHEDLYGTTRSRNEAYNAQLIDEQTGNLRHRTFTFNKNAPVALAIAMTVAVTNLRVLQQWDDTLDTNLGKIPWETGRKHKKERAATKAAARQAAA